MKEDKVMANIRKRWEKLQSDGWTQQQLGEEMGYGPKSARKSVSQFLRSKDPRISVLRRFSDAVGISVSTLIR